MMTRFNAFLLFAAAIFVQAHAPAGAEEFVFTLDGFSRERFIDDWVMPDDPLLVRAVMMVGKQVEDCVSTDYLPLFAARNAAVAREMLEAGMPVDMRGQGRKTALFFVQDTETARVLLAAGADVNARDDCENTALKSAANGDIVELLLAHGATLEPDDLEHAPDAKAVRLLVAAGADVHYRDWDEKTLLHTARNADVMRELIAAGLDVNARDNNGNTPLYTVPDAESARLLIAAGADVNAETDGNYPASALATMVSRLGFPPHREQWNDRWDEQWIERQRVEIVRMLLAAGADVKKKDRFGNSTLMWAGNPEVVKLLLDAGAEVNARNKDGRTPLMRADDLACAKLLLEAGADVNVKDKAGRTAISYADTGARTRLLLDAGADAADVWRWGNPLFRVRDVDAATLFLELLRADGQDVKKLVNEQDEKGNTPLMHAVMGVKDTFFTHTAFKDGVPELDSQKWDWGMRSQDMLGLVRAFVAAGADVMLANTKGEIPLFYARKPETVRLLLAKGATQDQLDQGLSRVIGNNAPSESVRVLLEAGADANAYQPLGTLAFWSENLDSDIPAITRLLIDAGAEVNPASVGEEDEDGDFSALFASDEEDSVENWPPLDFMRDWEAVQMLIDAGAEVNPEWGYAPLHTQACYPLVVRTLIAVGADVNARTPEGRTPLFYARDPHSIRLLVAAGADVNARDQEGGTPLFEILRHQPRVPAAVKALIQAGADVNARDDFGGTPLTEMLEFDWEAREMLIAAGAVEEVKTEDDDETF